jgi:sugar phosphate permease
VPPTRNRRRRSIILTGAVLIALSGPGQTAGFSVFVDPITEALDVTRSQLTFAYLIGTLAASTTGTWLGRRLDRDGVASGLRLVAIALGTAAVLAALSPNLIVLTVAIYGLRSFGQTGMTLSASVFVAKNVVERRGAALGLLTAVGGSAIALTPLIASRLIPEFGWRTTWVLLGAVVVVVGLITSTRMVRLRLEHPNPLEEPVDEASDELLAPRNLRRNGFLVVTAGYATTGFVSTALAFHQIAVLGERGISATAAAGNFVPQSLAAAAVALGVGRLVDRVPGRIVIPVDMVLLAAAVGSVSFVDSNLGAVGFGIALGSAASAMAASEGTLLARWIGTATLGTWRGRMTSVMVISTAIAPFAFTLIADAAGSFSAAARLVVILPLAVAIIALLTPLPEDRTRVGVGTASRDG